MSSTEKIALEVLTLLRNNLSAKLALTGETEMPNSFFIGEPELLPASKLPLISVDIPQWTQPRREGGIPRRQERVTQIVCYCLVSGPTPEEISKKLMRYVDAICAILEENPRVGGANLQNVNRGDFSPAIKERGVLLRAGAVSATLTLIRDKGGV